MAVTGLGFMLARDYWSILIAAFVGNMNPTAGDVSSFLPLEHTVLTQIVEPRRRTALFARHSLVGTSPVLQGALAASIPDFAANLAGVPHLVAIELMFGFYGVLGIVASCCTGRCRRRWRLYLLDRKPRWDPRRGSSTTYGPVLHRCFRRGLFRAIAARSVALPNFGISVTTAAAILFWSSICSAISYLLAVPISERFGLINTMVFTHLPSNICLILVPFAPSPPTTIGLLLVRSALSQMDAHADLLCHGRSHSG